MALAAVQMPYNNGRLYLTAAMGGIRWISDMRMMLSPKFPRIEEVRGFRIAAATLLPGGVDTTIRQTRRIGRVIIAHSGTVSKAGATKISWMSHEAAGGFWATDTLYQRPKKWTSAHTRTSWWLTMVGGQPAFVSPSHKETAASCCRRTKSTSVDAQLNEQQMNLCKIWREHK